MICGVDEVGRGALAGPVFACAAILPAGCAVAGQVADSKTLTAARRQALADALRGTCRFALGAASVAEIDRLNIRVATHLAMRRALVRLFRSAAAGGDRWPFLILIDGHEVPRDLPWPSAPLIDGDALEPAIAAASILAKVARDALMARLHHRHPAYGWGANVGYGTAAHRAALQRLGSTPWHRQSFTPVRNSLPQPVENAD